MQSRRTLPGCLPLQGGGLPEGEVHQVQPREVLQGDRDSASKRTARGQTETGEVELKSCVSSNLSTGSGGFKFPGL